ncbi:hypothetical protein [Photorhabdus sp. RW14-46]|uniref:hypothetical protein n=1 Tax=Photorhabdus sp. RW14-46 TaxID=2100168 RepID=UPI0013F46054|nr:hypothetical protein [Photorhabdus sp. RW14-46]
MHRDGKGVSECSQQRSNLKDNGYILFHPARKVILLRSLIPSKNSCYNIVGFFNSLFI